SEPFYSFSVRQSAHVANIGWTGPSPERVLGTTGFGLRMEAMRLEVASPLASGGVEYAVHAANIGWMAWEADGAMAGTTGQARQLEAVRMRLTGGLADTFDLYYRAHIAGYGWLGWAANGADAGSSSRGIRMEAVEVRLVPKGAPAPGTRERAFLDSRTNDPWLDNQIHSIVAANGYNLWNCFRYVAGFRYIGMSIYPTGDWAPPFAREMLVNQGGNCYRYAALFCCLAWELGYDARVVSGHVQSVSMGFAAHGWVEITIGGQRYIFDPDMVGSGNPSMWYQRTYSNPPIGYYDLNCVRIF
ncbi:MAG: arylamine N-acetyltransferase, partial [Coriobacteriaceae bacterium]|nr:arylamine N-acetyltransferase [Coriobacteriaceae bacterium]